MATTIDTRGLSCPQPVLMFLNAVKADAEGPFSVLTDNDASLENVSRAARNRGFAVETSPAEDGATRIDIRKAE
ncbi:MAG: sulfurtransferase TusA family protein [Desulfovibrio sp.]|uniref:sulfurtransferase TusA family protein n=1 Tax=uncultured Desulfovibrio sp. TaxID=167968 RepID=UPI001B21B9BF|nr:sulfurtransferase TusA family protein [uncultured Desulfovibrio sp.]MBE6441608.1 preprotein translocase subunit TatB [Desulfovibrio desulfuricans]MBO5490513.1 sulfurtransferase TusA family protein [Desulfovibrio sp.]MBO6170726.1 sulfurtransferase TusA family protein [Desulfovibrio sp.]